MDENCSAPEIEVDIVRLDNESIDDHLRSSTIVLQEILEADNKPAPGQDGYSCQSCGKLYKTAASLFAHNKLKHPADSTEVTCEVCHKSYPSLLSLQKHKRYMHLFQHRCSVCYRAFPDKYSLASHKTECFEGETACPTCGKLFVSPVAVRNHVKYKHAQSKQHWCKLCRREFTSSRSLSNHEATLHSASATQCRWCDREFNSVQGLQNHVMYKHTQHGVRCTQCYKVFVSRITLGRHMMKTHKSKGPDFPCNVCANKNPTSQELVDHVIHNQTDK